MKNSSTWKKVWAQGHIDACLKGTRLERPKAESQKTLNLITKDEGRQVREGKWKREVLRRATWNSSNVDEFS
jgi:hypothetical protein